MIITRLTLKNWRNFKQADTHFSDRAFIIGPNASGKSNLLDSMRFLRDLARAGGGLQRALTERGGLSKVRCLAARRGPHVEIGVELGESGHPPVWKYSIGVAQQVRGNRQPVVKFEKVWHEGTQILDRPDELDKKDDLRLTQSHLEQISANSTFRDVAKFLESIRYLHLVPQLLRHPEQVNGGTDEDPFGRGFLEHVAKTSESTRKARLKKIQGALQGAVPFLKELTDTKDEAGVPHLEAVYQHWRPNAGRQREDQFSDGTIRLIGLFWSLLDGHAPLLLEEPELSLHPFLVNQLTSIFSQLQTRRKRQLFISTHSPDMLSDKGIGGEEVVLLTPDLEGTTVRIGTSFPDIRESLEGGLSVADVALAKTRPPALVNLNLFE